MSNIIDFKPLATLKPPRSWMPFSLGQKPLCPRELLTNEFIREFVGIWTHGIIRELNLAPSPHMDHREIRIKDKKYMQPAFMDFAKALIVYYRVFRGKKSAKDILSGARILEVALVEVTGSSDITRVSAAICNRACEKLKAEFPDGNSAYIRSKHLEKIIVLMRDKGLLAHPFRWTSPLQYKSSGTLKEQQRSREKNYRAASQFKPWVSFLITI